MKKRFVFSSIMLCLIISNIITIYFYFHYKLKYEKELQYNVENVYILEGENSNWRFEDSILILGKYKKYFSGKSLQYIGNKQLDTNYLEIIINIKEKGTNKFKERLFHIIHDAKNNKNVMSNNKINLGQTNSTSEKLIKYNYDLNLDSYICVEIKYNNEGKSITENIKLQVKPIYLSNFENNK